MRRFAQAIAIAAGLALALPTGAVADDPPRTDPEIGSPSEAVYGIPFEEARRDAAPRIVPGAAIRTENALGSSARVPGRRAGGSAGEPEKDPEQRGEQRRKRRVQAARAATRLSGDPSPAATTLVLALVVGLGIGGGLFAGRLVGPRARP